MEWRDSGFIIAIRPHGESSAIITVLTREHGRHAGYVKGALSKRNKQILDLGNEVSLRWFSRLEDNLGGYDIDLNHSYAADYIDHSLKLAMIQSACAMADQTLPEREPHPAVYEGFRVLMEHMDSDVWGETYIFWELALIRELGFGLDLLKCAATGNAHNSHNDPLTYVSPKTGRAVSLSAGQPYHDKLLRLPPFLIGEDSGGLGDILDGLKLTGHFLENRIYTHTYQTMPSARRILIERMRKKLGLSAEDEQEDTGQAERASL